MTIKRSEFGLWAASTLALTALPLGAFADDGDTVTPVGAPDAKGNPKGVRSSGKVHTEPPLPKTQTSITHEFTSVGLGPFPQGVKMSLTIDDNGSFRFTGTIPPQKLSDPSATVFAIGLKGGVVLDLVMDVPLLIVFVEQVEVTNAGTTWNHTGQDKIVAGLWRAIVNGHTWHTAAESGVPGDFALETTHIAEDIALVLGAPVHQTFAFK